MKKIKSNKGITLLALIVTIIVLLILAIVSIRLIINEGIFNKAETAVKDYEIAQEKEQITLAYQEYQMQKANGEKNPTLTIEGETVDGNEANGWKITFNKCGHEYNLSKDGKIEGPIGEVEDTETTEADFTYTENEDGSTVTITGVTGNASIVNIPEQINGKTVTTIGSFSMSGFKTTTYDDGMILPNVNLDIGFGEGQYDFITSTTTEYKQSYYDQVILDFFNDDQAVKKNANTNIKKVIIPSTVTTLKVGAFALCRNLEEVEIPTTVTTIEDSAFAYCNNLREVVVHASVLGESMFCCDVRLSTVELPESITEIPRMCFYDCYGLEKIRLPKSLKEIKSYSFWHTLNLKNIYMSDLISNINTPFGENSNNRNPSYIYDGTIIHYAGTEEEWNRITKDIPQTNIIVKYNEPY